MKKLVVIVLLLTSFNLFAYFKNYCANDRVNFANYAGVILEIFNNGNAKIELDNQLGIVFKNIDTLGLGVKCNEHICQDYRVIFSQYTGTVIEVFSNGNAKVKLDYTNGHIQFKKVSDLSVEVNCLEDLCKGDRVNFEHYTGNALELYSNGIVKILLDNRLGLVFKNYKTLGF